MARIITNPDWTTKRQSREKYPYAEWFDGKTRQLILGEDFHCSYNSMVSLLYAAAERHDVQIRTKRVDPKTIQIQAI